MGTEDIIICRCHDITEKDVRDAIHAGFDDLELLRRYLHLGMGTCQGRVCINMVQRILRQETGMPIREIGFPTVRPPISNIPAKVLAFKGEVSSFEDC
ncbi:(2Fe-2S)-binding protein [uncultured Cloacibacillus sp.]|uniref:(2Fe-2S)-binding protein n=1 Tax=uncultured Cloacibacillus sp. TaxID=889794 RepID=UPI0026DD7475|nr:(2Fe-2S)-binding protein [uncultured Cloacibacillus sp.]